MLFCDLVGFTSRAERLDPEDVRALLSPYHAHLRSELERFGGTVEKFIGDAVMALFGAPVAHEDDPERAVRAALAIRDWIVEEGRELQVRIAVATGEALVTLGTRPSEGEPMAAGDVINTASRLQAAAPVNGILVGEQTYHATARAIEYREAPPVVAKGKNEPVSVWEALHARSRYGVDITQQAATPLFGRGRELELLTSTLARVSHERSPQLVTLVGVPGIGKSRLVFELFQYLVRTPEVFVTWRQGRSLPYGEGVTFWALSEIVKAQAGILETDTPAQAEVKLRTAVDAAVPETLEPRWIERHLRPLAGLPDERAGDGQEAAVAWRRFLEALADERPLVVVFEDLHWADDVLLDFVDQLVERTSGVPLLVLATARPELLERRPGWGGGKPNALTISLPPLSDEDTAGLLAALLEGPLSGTGSSDELLARAGGNPLYAEQYARVLRERGASEDVPDTVQGIIAARLDALSGGEKRLLQDAAVVGKVFWLGAVEAVDGLTRWQAEELLHGLERKEFVHRARRSSVASESEYAFRHLLIRDVAYSQIPRAARSEKHRSAAAWIESLGRPEDHAEMLSHHYMQALEYARASGTVDATVAESARLSLREAGERASSLGAYAAAARFYAAALELWPPEDTELADLLLRCGRASYQGGESRIELLTRALDLYRAAGDAEGAAEAASVLADLFAFRGENDTGQEFVQLALGFLAHRPASPAKAAALIQRSAFCMRAAEYPDAIRSARDALPMIEAPGLEALRSRAFDLIGISRVMSGEVEGVRDIEDAVAIAQAAHEFSQLARAYNNLRDTQIFLGQMVEAGVTLERHRRNAERLGRADSSWTDVAMVGDRFRRGLWDEALALADDLGDEFLATPHYTDSPLLTCRAAMRHARHHFAGASADTMKALELAREIGDQQVTGPALAGRACVLFANGRRDQAVPLASELLGRGSLISLVGEWTLPWLIEFVWLVRDVGLAPELLTFLEAVPDIPWAEIVREILAGEPLRAAAMLKGLGFLPGEAYARLRVAETLAAEGRNDECDAQLALALPFYRSVGATRFVKMGEELLQRR